MRGSDLTSEDVAAIEARLNKGEFIHEIAADYRINQGRIAEIKKRMRARVASTPKPISGPGNQGHLL